MTEPSSGTLDLTTAQRRRSIAVILASALAAGLAFGATMPLITLSLEARGISPTLIGLNAATASLALLLTGPFLPRIAGLLGTLRSIYVGIGLCILPLLLMPVFTSLPAWFLFRFVLGIGVALPWVVSEIWLNMVVTETNRGRVIGLYITMLAGGFAGGPLLISLVGTGGSLPFFACAGLLLAAALPLPFAHGVAPTLPPRPAVGVWTIIMIAPLTMATAFIAGFGDSAAFTLLPIYGLRHGFEQQAAVLLLSVFVAGNIALQLPFGWLSDRIDRRSLLAVCAFVGIVGPVLLPVLLHSGPPLWLLLFVWGGVVFGLYTIGLAVLGQRFPGAALPGANAAFVMIYELGSLTGPAVAGAAMDLVGPPGLPLALGIGCALLFGVAVFRRRAAGRG